MSEVSNLDAGLDLLDRQVLDVNDVPVGKVDDVEISEGDPPEITSLLLGPVAYGTRLGGRFGGSIAGAGARLARTRTPIRIPIELVKDIGVSIRLTVSSGDLARVHDLDHWLRDHLIARIPGAGHASE